MNDEPSSSASAGPAQAYQDGDEHSEYVPTPAQVAERRKKNRANFNKRRGELLDDLLRSLDILVYAELSAIYYMDCSFFRFILRAFIQLVFITPKPAFFPDPPSQSRPFIGGIFGSNILCFLLHLYLSAPSAGEPTRGYLHGGLAMDFIGQKGPTSKIHLVLLDVLVLILQVVQLSVHVLRTKLKDEPAAAIAVTTSVGNQYSAQQVSAGQSLEDEERGVRRSQERERADDMEMQSLNPSGIAARSDTDAAPDDTASRDALLASTSPPQRTDAHIFDAFNSGQIVIADLDLVRTIREQFWLYQKAPRDTNSAEANRLMRERLASRMLRWRFDSR